VLTVGNVMGAVTVAYVTAPMTFPTVSTPRSIVAPSAAANRDLFIRFPLRSPFWSDKNAPSTQVVLG
jgi:hypothetical protein